MRNWVIWCVVLLAIAGTACSKDSKQPQETEKGTVGRKTPAQPPDRGQGANANEVPKVSWPERVPRDLTVDLGGGVKMEFVLIPAGSFTMGNDKERDDEKPAHKVTITKPFYLGKYEVTQEEWQAVMGSNPSGFKGPKNPVDSVSWDDCQAFLAKLNEKSGSGDAKFSLPTEAQWEYACRAGTTTQFSFGDEPAKLDDHAWWRGNDYTTHPVGGKKPNAWGLYDMHGNVWEWCADRYGAKYYPRSPSEDPAGPSIGSSRVLRGGSWSTHPSSERSAVRDVGAPDVRVVNYGFRAARTLTP